MLAYLPLLVSLLSAQQLQQLERDTPRLVPDVRPNIVLIIADDMGVDLVNGYGEANAMPCTPNIDSLAASGLLFRNAWTNPVCSPTRAAILTGRYGFRTGIGGVVTNQDDGLSVFEATLPRELPGYASTAVGKWHLQGTHPSTHPNDIGFGHYAGSLTGALPSYYQWRKTVDGSTSFSTTYATTDAVHEAIAAMSTMPEPWFLYLAFNAPHTPNHVPPPGLCPTSGCTNTFCASLSSNPNSRQFTRAMTEAMDTEIGRFLGALDAVDPRAYVFFMGDNGTTSAASIPPFRATHAKGSLYEGGINVPLIVRGPGVAIGESLGLVGSTDLFATFAELASSPSSADDSVSMVPYFLNPAISLRTTVYTEIFSPNGGTLPFTTHIRAVRGERYKLIRGTNQTDEFYDLQLDAFEVDNLLPSLNAGEQAAFDELAAELTALGVG